MKANRHEIKKHLFCAPAVVSLRGLIFLQIFYEEEAVGAVFIVTGDAAEFTEAVFFVKSDGAVVRHLHREPEAGNPAEFEAAEEAFHEDGGGTVAEDGRVDGERDEFGANSGPAGAQAGNGRSDHLSPP